MGGGVDGGVLVAWGVGTGVGWGVGRGVGVGLAFGVAVGLGVGPAFGVGVGVFSWRWRGVPLPDGCGGRPPGAGVKDVWL